MKNNKYSEAEALARWAEPVPDMGKAIYQVTSGPAEHKHAYYFLNPWSLDGKSLIFAEYDRKDPAAAICVMDTATGKISAAGHSLKWDWHTAAYQQWQGCRNRLFYLTSIDGVKNIISSAPDGSSEKAIPVPDLHNEFSCSPDGSYAFEASSLESLFPENSIAPRHDKGLFRIDLETGSRKLIVSIEKAIETLPRPIRDSVCNFHMHILKPIPHPRRPRLLFNLSNVFWSVNKTEPRTCLLMSVGTDGSDPVYLGGFSHHPNWNSCNDMVVANLLDVNKVLRLGLYRDTQEPGLVEYVPATRGSGHPSFSPDGRWICTDGSGPQGNQIILCDPDSGRKTVIAEADSVVGQYPIFKAINGLAPGKTVMDAFAEFHKSTEKAWYTQHHPTWSRDGSAILFNADRGNGSQLYMVDVKRALEGI